MINHEADAQRIADAARALFEALQDAADKSMVQSLPGDTPAGYTLDNYRLPAVTFEHIPAETLRALSAAICLPASHGVLMYDAVGNAALAFRDVTVKRRLRSDPVEVFTPHSQEGQQ